MKSTTAANLACKSCWLKSCAHSTLPQCPNWYSSSNLDNNTAFFTSKKRSTQANDNITDLSVSTA